MRNRTRITSIENTITHNDDDDNQNKDDSHDTKDKKSITTIIISSLFCRFILLMIIFGVFGGMTSQFFLFRLDDDNTIGSDGRGDNNNAFYIINNSSNNKHNNSDNKKFKNATATVAYAISLIKCGDKQSNDAGLVDAALVLRHSIHRISIRNPSSGSRYDYKMYAIVHGDAVACSQVLEDAGFTIVVKDPPVQPNEIKGEYLRTNIHTEWCCGYDEFIKLYAYTLQEPIIVHVDIDFLFLQSMDILFDAIIHDKDTVQGEIARSKIIPLIEEKYYHHQQQQLKPQSLTAESTTAILPDKIDAFITKDWPQVIPGRKALYQAGFLVARRRPETLQETINLIKEGDYKEGYDLKNGWGAAGYGGFVGAMAVQGLMAYYYDIVKPNTAVELNQCRFNHMGMDVRYRHPPNFISRKVKKIGKCRNNREECEDCMTTNVSLIYNVHYTECRKPWNCIGVGHGGGRIPGGKPGSAIDTNAGNFEHCMQLQREWHGIRLDLENFMFKMTGDKEILRGILGGYKREVFRGHCRGEGGQNYTKIQGLERIEELYR